MASPVVFEVNLSWTLQVPGQGFNPAVPPVQVPAQLAPTTPEQVPAQVPVQAPEAREQVPVQVPLPPEDQVVLIEGVSWEATVELELAAVLSLESTHWPVSPPTVV
jgi:hypothetical protein